MLQCPDIQEMERRLDAIPAFNSMCFELFRLWTAEVKKQQADWEPDIEDEQEIVEEVRRAYIKAIQASYDNPEDVELLDMREYYIVASSVTGYVQGNLGAVWTLRYLPKNEYYRKMLWMKSFTQYFLMYEEAAEEVNRLFTTYLQAGFLIKHDSLDITLDDLSFYKVMADLQFEKNKPEIISVLMTVMYDYTLKFMTNTKNIDGPNVLDVFGAPNVTFLVTGRWYKATLEGPLNELPEVS